MLHSSGITILIIIEIKLATPAALAPGEFCSWNNNISKFIKSLHLFLKKHLIFSFSEVKLSNKTQL
jgi:hypothetical protein